jgi:hypothetical protein
MKRFVVRGAWIPALLILLGASTRLAPHPWNFTPIMAVGLYAGARSTRLLTAALITVAALLFSDSILGFYSGMTYVYAASLVPVALGWWMRDRAGVGGIIAAATVGSLSFFFITNAAIWAKSSMYPHTWAGLGACFTAGLPFYRNEIAGDAVYACALFGSEALLFHMLRLKRQAA